MSFLDVYGRGFSSIPWSAFWPVYIISLVGVVLLSTFFLLGNRRSLTSLFVLVIPGFTMITLSLLFLTIGILNFRSFAEERNTRIRQSVSLLESALVQKLMLGLYLDASNILGQLNVTGALAGSAVVTPDGQLLSQYPKDFYLSSRTFAEAPIFSPDHRVQWGTLKFLPDLEKFQTEEKRRLKDLTFLAILFGGVLTIFSFVLSRICVSRVQSITEILEKLKEKLKQAKSIDDLGDSLMEPVTTHAFLRETKELEEVATNFGRTFRDANRRMVQLESRAQLGDFASIIFHNLKSPIATLGLMIDLEKYPQKKAKIVGNSLNTVSQFIKDLLDKKRELEESGGPVDFSFLKPATPESLAPLLESIVEEKNIEFGSIDAISFKSSGNSSLSNIDPIAFRAVISNLINNSWEALTNGRGKIEVSLNAWGNSHAITIRDSGKGIPPHLLPDILQSRKSFRKPEGNGMGLYHADNVVRAWGGKIEIRSMANEWTEVSIFLPANS